MRIKSLIRAVLGIIATILLGAIGSGVWEKILSPSLNYTGYLITTTSSSLSSSYSDAIYSRASTIPYGNTSGHTSGVILFIVFTGLLLFALDAKKDNKFIAFILNVFWRPMRGWPGIIVCCANIIVVLFLLSEHTSVSRIRSYSLNQMDILRPYIGEQQYYKLRSDYLRIKNENAFNDFLKKMYSLSSSVSVDIEKYSRQ